MASSYNDHWLYEVFGHHYFVKLYFDLALTVKYF